MSFPIPPSIFREYDIRGIAGKDLGPEFAHHLGRTYAHFLCAKQGLQGRPGRVAVGRDCRLTSESYAEALIEGLRQGGLEVFRLGVCATPVTYFSLFHLGLDGAIMVTGSHNRAEYNGFKIMVGKRTIHGPQIQELRRLMEEAQQTGFPSDPHPKPLPGSVKDHPIIPTYIDELAQQARRPLRPMKIVIDAGNGAAGVTAPELFRRLGAEVIPLYCELDGRFPHHHPDPTVPANLATLVAHVRAERADFGVAFDGDADRIGIVDETGRILFGDDLMVIFARQVLAEHPGATILSEVKSSHRLFDEIRARGGKAVMCPAGHAIIKAKMVETGALLAGEMSGHIFFADRYLGFDDAMYAALRYYETVSAAGGPASALLQDFPPLVSTPELRLASPDEWKFRLIEAVTQILSGHYRTTDIDGVRVEFGDAWGLARASNTEPAIVLRYEAPSEERLREIRAVIEGALLEAATAIGHPPLPGICEKKG